MDFNKIDFLSLDKTYQLVQGFSCGNDWINDYLKQPSNAIFDHRLGISSTTTLVYENEIVAFFTANCSHLEIPMEEAREIGLKDDLFIPAVEVKYLGVKEKYQTNGIGTYLLQFIIGKVLEITPVFACRYIFLWAVEDKIEYYEKRYFQLTGKEENGLYLMKFLIPTYEWEEE
ncbi:GNAT family N-acetyltransferase [Metabacillus fastidiosus]|uniref:GNAT family N-acetyltransferase n=1 Tax=Metabacillus fastidiosus TaxID=1458 RepID=A0ABU6NYS8_9BACI|nr:GNAT family N-acetyltransferase [Metabacillus fastidiosus]MED4402284.1 GNAT family N-acetyltransferase [Metabacillus fastidiosus]MED4454936.1 GNAT family N-acetyltransferase [Metabacillus fastidiosus]MED4462155.1 GNAT family N-acetyltransferase [Metabacillus fastidiosus]